jgi:methionyl-tRNA formyltransferase
MRLVVIGQAPFGRECLQALVNQGENVVGAITVPDTGRPNPFKELAVELGLPLLQPRRLRDAEVYEWVKFRNPDLLVLVFVTDYVPPSVIQLATHGGINYHPSLLPKYRGGNAIAWAIICGEKETGVTIHYIDEGIDTGDIVLWESVPIDPDDTTVTLYYNKLFPLGVRLVAEAVRLIREGRAPRIPQDPRLASYQPLLTEKHTYIDWRQPVHHIYNLIRGSVPVPAAHCTWRGRKLLVHEARPWRLERDDPPARPGRVISLEEEGFVVATGWGQLLVKRVQVPGGPKVPAVEFAAGEGLVPGEELA